MAFVLVHNLAPDHKNILTVLIRRYTTNVIAHHGALDEGVHFIEKHFLIKALAAKVRDTILDRK
jgi:two-component system cell cycle sensor histidine kinase/response regulator CckA